MPQTALHSASATTPGDTFRTEVSVPGHDFVSDAPASSGGTDEAASPMALLTAALASCTTMTIRSYASRKKWPLASVSAAVEHLPADDEQPERFVVALNYTGELTPEQAEALDAIALRCPVHKALAHTTPVEVARG